MSLERAVLFFFRHVACKNTDASSQEIDIEAKVTARHPTAVPQQEPMFESQSVEEANVAISAKEEEGVATQATKEERELYVQRWSCC